MALVFSTDVDECKERQQPCMDHSTCYNWEGGYTCACHLGYDLDEMTGQCVGVYSQRCTVNQKPQLYLRRGYVRDIL